MEEQGKVDILQDIESGLICPAAAGSGSVSGKCRQCRRDWVEQCVGRYKRLIEAMADYVYTVEIADGVPVRTVHGYNCAVVTGYLPEEYAAIPSLWFEMIHPEDREAVLEKSSRILRGEAVQPFEHRILHKDGSIRWVRNAPSLWGDLGNGVIVYDGLIRDITERKRFEEQLIKQANYDFLTGLPNRYLFHDRMKSSMAFVDRHKQFLAVILLDLDRFKNVNDTFGHTAGDLILKDASARICRCIRRYDTAARIGGDEFVILLNDIGNESNLTLFTEKLIGQFAEPFFVDGEEVFVTVSAGIAIFPADGDSVEMLIKNADAAMYHAKEQGRNCFRFFTENMNIKVRERLVMESRLRRALERGEFSLQYQPRLSIDGGVITGIEALLRWHPAGSAEVSPAEFIPLLEETGLILPVGEWVLRTAAAQNRIWQEVLRSPIPVAVNISARQFRQYSLAETVRGIMEGSGIGPGLLEIELTESILIQDADEATRTIRELKEMGISISVDDFGTGYSSLSYLKRFDVDYLKIDKSFVRGVAFDENDAAIVTAIIAMAHGLRLKVVAEGVETREQLEFLAGLGCDEVQGYYFSRPLPVAEIEGFILGRGVMPAASDRGSSCPPIRSAPTSTNPLTPPTMWHDF